MGIVEMQGRNNGEIIAAFLAVRPESGTFGNASETSIVLYWVLLVHDNVRGGSFEKAKKGRHDSAAL